MAGDAGGRASRPPRRRPLTDRRPRLRASIRRPALAAAWSAEVRTSASTARPSRGVRSPTPGVSPSAVPAAPSAVRDPTPRVLAVRGWATVRAARSASPRRAHLDLPAVATPYRSRAGGSLVVAHRCRPTLRAGSGGAWALSGGGLSCRARAAVGAVRSGARSSRGLGRRPFKPEIAGSKPARATSPASASSRRALACSRGPRGPGSSARAAAPRER